MNRFKKILTFIFLLSIFFSCKKEKISLQWEKIYDSNHPLHSIYFVNDSDTGFVVGGERYDLGVILKTTDGGKNWSGRSIGSKAFYDVFFLNSQIGFVVGYDGFIFKTNDGGGNWQEIHSDSDWGKIFRKIIFINDSIGFITGGSGYDKGYILKTIDGGNNWVQKIFDRELRDIFMFDEKSGYVSGYGIIYKTIDGGESWNATGTKGDFFMSMDFSNLQTGFIVGYEGTILKTNDGGNKWDKLKNGNNIFTNNQFLVLDFWNQNVGYVVGAKGVILKTSDSGSKWKEVKTNFSDNINSISLVNANSGFVVTEGGNIYRFTN